jgi:hypothetical protein
VSPLCIFIIFPVYWWWFQCLTLYICSECCFYKTSKYKLTWNIWIRWNTLNAHINAEWKAIGKSNIERQQTTMMIIRWHDYGIQHQIIKRCVIDIRITNDSIEEWIVSLQCRRRSVQRWCCILCTTQIIEAITYDKEAPINYLTTEGCETAQNTLTICRCLYTFQFCCSMFRCWIWLCECCRWWLRI